MNVGFLLQMLCFVYEKIRKKPSRPVGGVFLLSVTVTCGAAAAEKMASEVISAARDEKAALIDEDVPRQCATAAAKLRLYHWTQSFNSQKVSECSGVSGPPLLDSSPPEAPSLT